MYKLYYLLFLPVFAFGQAPHETVSRKVTAANELFQVSSGAEYLVGTPYLKVYPGLTGSPFWATGQWSKADVLYKGEYYPVSMLKYDCANGVMVTVRYTERGPEYLALVPTCYPEILFHAENIVASNNGHAAKKYHSAGITDERFIFHSVSAEEAADGISSGYYHFRIDKKYPLLCRYTRSIAERSGQKGFVETEEFFLMQGDRLSRIRRVASLMDSFPQWADKIDAFAEENSINKLLPMNADDTVMLMEYINTLSVQ